MRFLFASTLVLGLCSIPAVRGMRLRTVEGTASHTPGASTFPVPIPHAAGPHIAPHSSHHRASQPSETAASKDSLSHIAELHGQQSATAASAKRQAPHTPSETVVPNKGNDPSVSSPRSGAPTKVVPVPVVRSAYVPSDGHSLQSDRDPIRGGPSSGSHPPADSHLTWTSSASEPTHTEGSASRSAINGQSDIKPRIPGKGTASASAMRATSHKAPLTPDRKPLTFPARQVTRRNSMPVQGGHVHHTSDSPIARTVGNDLEKKFMQLFDDARAKCDAASQFFGDKSPETLDIRKACVLATHEVYFNSGYSRDEVDKHMSFVPAPGLWDAGTALAAFIPNYLKLARTEDPHQSKPLE